MKLLVYISCVLAAAEFAVGGYIRRCYNSCDCKDYEYCMGEEMPICKLFTMGELAGEKHCACKSCEDDSSNDGSRASDVGDRRKRTPKWLVCTHDCICKNYSCPDGEIAYCKKEKNSQGDRMCGCKACSGDDNSDYDDE